MAKEAFRFSGEDALNYETYLGPLLFEPSTQEVLAFMGAPNVGAVLEIAGGTGRLTRHLRSYYSAATRLVATDISPDMLGVASSKLDDPSITFQVADAQQLPFPDASFDVVVCQYGWMFLPDKLKGCREVLRVLKPGGRFVFATWDRTENMPLLKLIFNELLLPFFKGEDTSRFLVPFSLYEPGVLLSFLQGFAACEVVPVEFMSGAATAEDIVNGFFLKHPLGRAVAEKDAGAVEPLALEMRERIAAQFGEGEVRVGLRAWIGIGHRPVGA